MNTSTSVRIRQILDFEKYLSWISMMPPPVKGNILIWKQQETV